MTKHAREHRGVHRGARFSRNLCGYGWCRGSRRWRDVGLASAAPASQKWNENCENQEPSAVVSHAVPTVLVSNEL